MTSLINIEKRFTFAGTTNTEMTKESSSPQEFSSTPFNNASTDEFLTYQNYTLGIKIQYPAQWNKTTVNDSVSFSSPLETDSDKFTESLSIAVNPLSTEYGQISLAEYVNMTMTNLRELLWDFEIHDLKPIIFKNGSEAMSISYTASFPEYGITKNLAIVSVKDGLIYLIEYVSKPQKYHVFLPIVQKMIDSFAFIPVDKKLTPLDLPGPLVADLILPYLDKLPPEDLARTLNNLGSTELARTLNNLGSTELEALLNKLPEQNFTEILNKLPVNERDAILQKLP